jgi:hypothetical protein
VVKDGRYDIAENAHRVLLLSFDIHLSAIVSSSFQ